MTEALLPRTCHWTVQDHHISAVVFTFLHPSRLAIRIKNLYRQVHLVHHKRMFIIPAWGPTKKDQSLCSSGAVFRLWNTIHEHSLNLDVIAKNTYLLFLIGLLKWYSSFLISYPLMNMAIGSQRWINSICSITFFLTFANRKPDWDSKNASIPLFWI